MPQQSVPQEHRQGDMRPLRRGQMTESWSDMFNRLDEDLSPQQWAALGLLFTLSISCIGITVVEIIRVLAG